MQAFYSCTEDYLLDLPIKTFWRKYKNMIVIKLRLKIESISAIGIAMSTDVHKHVYGLKWQLEQLSNVEQKIDGLSDLKKQFGGKKKKKKKGGK